MYEEESFVIVSIICIFCSDAVIVNTVRTSSWAYDKAREVTDRVIVRDSRNQSYVDLSSDRSNL